MTKTEKSPFQALLNATIMELEQLIRHRDGIKVERSADQLEEIQQASERALAVSNLDREFNQLRHAKAAIIRIREGTFGKRQQCDEDIHPKRLAVVPWTPFCIQCQEAFDHNPDELQAPPRVPDSTRLQEQFA
jgi:RNA polymerase-binding transcription factor